MLSSAIESLAATFTSRSDIVRFTPYGGIGVELGVAEGYNSERLLKSSLLSHLYSIDAWADHHDVNEYWTAVRRLTKFGNRSTVLRMRFDEAAHLFSDGYFDFVYVDGYAHTGEEGGQTFRDWWPKAKSGAVFGGDDYHGHWPMVVQEVDRFLGELGLRPHLVNCVGDDWASQYPTWFVIKP